MERKCRKQHRVSLSEERARTGSACAGRRGGEKAPARAFCFLRMKTGVAAAGGLSDADIASVFGVGRATVECVRKQCVLEGIGAALELRKQVYR